MFTTIPQDELKQAYERVQCHGVRLDIPSVSDALVDIGVTSLVRGDRATAKEMLAMALICME